MDWKFDTTYESFFLNDRGQYRRKHPEKFRYGIFRRNKVIEKGKEVDFTDADEFEYGIGQFFFDENDKIVSYDDNPPLLLTNQDLSVLIMQIEMLSETLNRPLIIIGGADGIVITRENVQEKNKRERLEKQKKKGNFTQNNE